MPWKVAGNHLVICREALDGKFEVREYNSFKSGSGEVVEMNNALFHQSWIGGVRVESTFPQAGGKKADPVMFVHGGCHGSWVFQVSMILLGLMSR
jgi:hypothetical protein